MGKARKKPASSGRVSVQTARTALKHHSAGAPSYGSQDYWEGRYSKIARGSTSNEADEWLLDYQQLRAILPFSRSASVLDLGCGISSFLKDLRMRGGARGRLVGIDYSATAVELCSRMHAARDVEYIEMDAKHMSFEDCHFDIVVDKATLDGQLCAKRVADATCHEVGRIVRPGGTYVIVTWRGPGRAGELVWLVDCVLPALQRGSGGHSWKVAIHSFESEDACEESSFGHLPNVFLLSKSKRKSRNPIGSPRVTQYVH